MENSYVVRCGVRYAYGISFALIFFINGKKSSCPEVFCKKDILRNFAKFAGIHLCQSLVFNKVAGLRPATLLKKRLCHRRFSVNFGPDGCF